MSPPTQLPKRSSGGNAGSGGRRWCRSVGVRRSASSNTSWNTGAPGTARRSGRSRRARIVGGRSVSPARLPVCQLAVSARRMRSLGRGARPGTARSMSPTRPADDLRSFSSSTRRHASVGCAVNTGSTRSRGSSAAISAAATPSRRAWRSRHAGRGLDTVAAALVVAAAADAVHCSARFDRLEIGREGAHQVGGLRQFDAGQFAGDLVDRRLRFAARIEARRSASTAARNAARAARPGSRHQRPEHLDVLAQQGVGGRELDHAHGFVGGFAAGSIGISFMDPSYNGGSDGRWSRRATAGHGRTRPGRGGACPPRGKRGVDLPRAAHPHDGRMSGRQILLGSRAIVRVRGTWKVNAALAARRTRTATAGTCSTMACGGAPAPAAVTAPL